MLVRSSKYHDLRVQLRDLEDEAETAKRYMREARVERDRARRELQESKDDYLHRLLHRHVIVHVKEPELSIEGHLVGIYEDSIAVANARVPVTPAGDVEQLGGLQIIPRVQIGWVTELNPA